MKITAIETFIVPPRWCFVKISTDEGISGWGEPVLEGRAASVAACVEELSDYLIGRDPRLIQDHWTVMYRAGFYRGGGIHMSAIAGIDQALWDIKGKDLGVPVHACWAASSATASASIPGSAATVGRHGADGARLRRSGLHRRQDERHRGDAVRRQPRQGRSGPGAACRQSARRWARFRHRHRFPRPGASPDGQGAGQGTGALPLDVHRGTVLSEHAEALREIANHCSIPIALGNACTPGGTSRRSCRAAIVDITSPIPAIRAASPRPIASPPWPRRMTWPWHCTAPAWPIALAAEPAAGRGLLQRLHPGTVAWHSLQPGQRPAGLSDRPVGLCL